MPSPSRATKRATAEDVFNVRELLEQILLHFTRFDLFVLQRVNKAFASTIKDSPKLQRELYTTIPHDDAPVYWGDSAAANDLNLHLHPLRPQPYVWNDHKMRVPDWFDVDVTPYYEEGWPWNGMLGWEGKDAVHLTGSWRNINLGVAQRGIPKVSIRWYENNHCDKREILLKNETTMGNLVNWVGEYIREVADGAPPPSPSIDYDFGEGEFDWEENEDESILEESIGETADEAPPSPVELDMFGERDFGYAETEDSILAQKGGRKGRKQGHKKGAKRRV